MRRHRTRRRHGRWRLWSSSTRYSLVATLACVLYLVGVNTAIRRVGGGDVRPWSFRHMGNKSAALLAFGKHLCTHAWRRSDADPEAAVRQAAERHDFPVQLALAVARAESGLRPHAISATGAMGLMQLMPATAQELGVADPFDPEASADGGVRYLVWLRRVYGGDRKRMLAAYNAGIGMVPRRGPMTLPAETRRYVARILGP